jgi:hypothetical protein
VFELEFLFEYEFEFEFELELEFEFEEKIPPHMRLASCPHTALEDAT